MDKQRYGIRQRVTEGDLNQLQDYAEAGIEAAASDIVVGGGVVKGMEVTPGGSFTVNLTAGRARDANGARASLLAGVALDLAAYRPTGGLERWATIMAYRIRRKNEPKVDPTGATYYFQLTEDTQLQVVTGEIAGAGASVTPARPTDGGVLLADVLLSGDTASLAEGDVRNTRREVYSPVANLPSSQITFGPGTGTGYAATVDQVQEALDDVGKRVQAHSSGTDPHPQYLKSSQKSAPGGVAALDGDGKVPAAQLPAMNYIPSSEKGAAGGVATLDAAARGPFSITGDAATSWSAVEEGIIIESALPVTGSEATQVQTSMGPAIEFGDGLTQAIVFNRRWPFTSTNLNIEIEAAMDTGVTGNVRLEVVWQVDGGAATSVPVTVTNLANTTTLVTVDLGQIIPAASLPVGSMVTIQISRLGADAADTHTGRFRLYHTRLKRG